MRSRRIFEDLSRNYQQAVGAMQAANQQRAQQAQGFGQLGQVTSGISGAMAGLGGQTQAMGQSDVNQLMGIGGLQQQLAQTGMNVGYLAMNFDKPPFDNHQIRLAINHAINKNVIIDQLYQGMGVPAKNPIPPTMWSYDETTTDYSYDPELSKKLLTAAGYANGFETELWALPVPRPYIPDGNALAVAIQSDLRRVGIETKIVTYDWGTYLEKTKNGDHTMAMLGWSADFADPDNFFYYLLSKNSARKPAGNIAFYRSEEMQEILDQARSTTDLAIRTKLYKRAQSLFNRDLPWVPLAHAKQMLIIHKSVKNVKLHSTTFKYFRRIFLG